MNNQALVDTIESIFLERHSKPPICILSPGRINIIGEHTDYNSGFVLPAAIDKSVVCAISSNDNSKKCTVFSVDFDDFFEFDLSNVKKQPDGSWKNYVLGVISEIQKTHVLKQGFDIVFGGNIPSGSGLSSSAALENSIAYGLNELFQLGLDKMSMVLISQNTEHNFANVQCGIMDQFTGIYGRENHALFLDCRTITYNEIPINLKDHEFFLVNTNVKHALGDSKYNTRRSECEEGVAILSSLYPQVKSIRDLDLATLDAHKDCLEKTIYNRCLYVIQENNRVEQMAQALKTNNSKLIGNLLFASHEGLQKLYEVSCPELDFLVNQARVSLDVIGSRMMGGGFGGCTINLVKKGKSQNFINQIDQTYNQTFGVKLNYHYITITQGTKRVK